MRFWRPSRWLPVRRRGADPLEGVNLLDLAPVRRAAWEEVEGLVVIIRPAPRGRGPKALGMRLSRLLSARRIRLDERGSYAWRRLNGRRTVAELAAEMREQFGDSIEPAEERLGQLVRMLRRESILAYPGWDD